MSGFLAHYTNQWRTELALKLVPNTYFHRILDNLQYRLIKFQHLWTIPKTNPKYHEFYKKIIQLIYSLSCIFIYLSSDISATNLGSIAKTPPPEKPAKILANMRKYLLLAITISIQLTCKNQTFICLWFQLMHISYYTHK